MHYSANLRSQVIKPSQSHNQISDSIAVKQKVKRIPVNKTRQGVRVLEKIIWVLVPKIETTDANLEYYYDFEQSLPEYKIVFESLGLSWKWQYITCKNFKEIIDLIIQDSIGKQPVFFNICDGDEINDIPGISVVKLLEEKGLSYTGAEEFFYNATTSKITMKELFEQYGIPTPRWQVIGSGCKNLFNKLSAPLIIKPAVSAGSMGVGVKSVVHDMPALEEQVKLLENGYRGWELSAGGILAEEFINGPEFTSFIIGDYTNPKCCHVYPPVERLFHQDLPDEQKFLSFDRLWEIYEDENPIGEGEDLYTYHRPDPALTDEINRISLAAYIAVKGTGYGRVDLRMDKQTKKIYVLEVNSQCGLSEDENYTSIGAILRLSNQTYPDLINEIINNALRKGKQ